ncbi:MAG TPA: T9SS type A sorting domain-containing protein [Candidatus Nitrosotenuis sp.]|nr:T9SS type A sorting domain-containing protein [Candidatus Nitrosotenuis sp.]
MRSILLMLFLIFTFCMQLISSSQAEQFCSMQGTSAASAQLGGRYKPASGTFKILVIYAQFTDDNTDINNSNWIKGQAPAYMNGTLDETWSSTPTSGSLTDFFNQMSFSQFKVIGKEVSITMPQTMQYYIDHGITKMYDMNKIAIQTADAQVNYAEFDNWRYDSVYHHTNIADNNVDMIYVVWRNMNPSIGLWSGIGALNDWPYTNIPFSVEGGTRNIQTGFEGYGSGVTIINGYYGTWWVYRGMQHELAHWFFGRNDHHTPSGTWGILEGWGTPSDCINAYERYKLGWMNFNTIDPSSYANPTTINITLPDFITTGVAYRIKVPGGGADEYFILENHQRISQFDVPDNNSNAAGIFVLHQTADIGNAVRVASAEGKFNWSVPYTLPNIYGSSPAMLPVFQRGTVNRASGYCRRERIPWYGGNDVIVYELINGSVVKAGENGNPTVFTGTGKDQFDLSNNNVFTPASNPSTDIYNNATKVGFEVTGISNGVYTLNIHVKNPESASPSKPQNPKLEVYSGGGDYNPKLTWAAMLEQDVTNGGNIYVERSRKNMNVYPYNWSAWQTIATLSGASTEYIDQGITTAGMGNDSVKYRIRARDSQNKYSVYSEEVKMRYDRNLLKRGLAEPKEYLLSQNYPNPFNPSTAIKYEIPEDASVVIKVYNLLGKEVATLVNGFKTAGYYEATFDAGSLSSGIYIYRLTAGKYSEIRKMTLMK